MGPANGIPARALCGRVVIDEGRPTKTSWPHARAEFFAQGIGWVPVDVAGAIRSNRSPDGLDRRRLDRGPSSTETSLRRSRQRIAMLAWRVDDLSHVSTRRMDREHRNGATSFFLWCSVLNYVFLLVWVVVASAGRDWLCRFSARLIRVTPEQLDLINIAGITLYKMGIFFFNIVPCIALTIAH